jgi:hypothetical protein
MHSLISIVRVVLTDKENYLEWSKKIKHTLIFNDLWNDICEGEVDGRSTIPTTNKELAIWNKKYKKAYVVIVATTSEEVSCHIISIEDSNGSLKKLKNFYDSCS